MMYRTVGDVLMYSGDEEPPCADGPPHSTTCNEIIISSRSPENGGEMCSACSNLELYNSTYRERVNTLATDNTLLCD